MKKKSSDYLGKVLLLSLLLVVVDLIGGFANLRFTSWYKWISTIILVGVLIFFCIQYANEQTEGATFGKIFGYGFRIALFISILMVVYTIISVMFIFPEFIDQVLVRTRTEMENKGSLSEDQIDRAITMTKKYFLPGALVFAFLGTLFFGTIGSLLGAAFARKSEPNVFQNNP